MALKKSSKFEDMDSGLFSHEASQKPEEHEKQQEEENNIEILEKVDEEAKTEQKKEAKGSCRMSISFKPDTYRYVSIEARRRGMTISKFVNQAMEEYKASPKGRAPVEDWL